MKSALVIVSLVLSSLTFAQTDSMTVAEAARAPRTGKKAAHVYTNDEIPSRPEPVPEVKTPEAKADATKPPALEEAKPATEEDKKLADTTPEEQADTLKVKLASVQKEIADLQAKMSDESQDRDAVLALIESKQDSEKDVKAQLEELMKKLEASKKPDEQQ